MDKVDAAIARAAHWVQSRVTEQGFRGCEHHIQAHYNAPYCLSRLGKVTDAARVMRHVLARFHDEGTFHRNVMPGGSAHGNG